MKCKHEFNRLFVDSFCTKRFRNIEYKKHRENVLFDTESARLPETQPYATRILDSRGLQISFCYIVEILRRVTVGNVFDDHVNDIVIEVLRTQIITISETMRYLNSGEVPQTINVFTVKCPISECRGFLFDDWKCGICKKVFCESCNEELCDTHICDQNLVKTVKLLKRDTKACPKCTVPIHKIDGCAQMWCTQCHVAFDWRTGLIDTGRIHNPHYVQFFKRTREHSDIPCGGCPTYQELKRNKATRELLDAHLELTRLQRELVIRYGYMYDDNHHLRIKYLLGELSDDQFKRELHKRDKSNDKVRDVQDIYRMFIDTVSDALRKFLIYPDTIGEICDEIRDIILYTNEVIHDIRNRYMSRLPYNIISASIK